MHPSIFELVLGKQADGLPEPVQNHFFLSADAAYKIVLEGHMEEVWHRPQWIKPVLALLSLGDTLFPDTGKMVELRLENTAYRDQDGTIRMDWKRSFFFPRRTRMFNAVMKYDPARNVIVDYFGRKGEMEVDLLVEPWQDQEASGLLIRSGAHCIRIGSMRVKLPNWLQPQATVKEWAEPGMSD
ncbi:DUF4166 domain-containing protein [Effusibacillus consociatus]|uniref:DUF4166 domain-containing protein n=1 Tax=Effusibacillus consociatus TaxID=1117041 RepID=A0ABV9PVN3_9BACL